MINKYPQNSKEQIVCSKFSERPHRPEELSSELRRRNISRATFYRIIKRLTKESLIYVISDEEKKGFGLVDEEGQLLKGKYYFYRNEGKLQRWAIIMKEMEDYNGLAPTHQFLKIVSEEFSGYPLVSTEDIIETARFHDKIPRDDLYNDEEKLFKFLAPQIRRISKALNEDEREKAYLVLIKIFDSCTNRLLGTDQIYTSDEHSRMSFDILCNVSSEDKARKLVKSLFNRKIDPGKDLIDIKSKFLPDLIKIFSKHFGKSSMLEFLDLKIRKLSDMEIEYSLKNPSKIGNISRLKENLIETRKELSSN